MNTRHLRLLGEPAVRRGEIEAPLGRKIAALLAYLALQGPTPRSKAAGLLWPEASERAARADLRQLLRRSRDRYGEGLIVADDPLRLAHGVEVDAARLKIAAFQGRSHDVLSDEGVLLETFDFDDCPPFEDWLLSEREALVSLRRTALLDAIAELERSGALAEALGLCEALIRLDPISETAHGLSIRLHAQRGDRAAALRAYDRLCAVLDRELGLEPSLEVARMAQALRHGRTPPLPAPEDAPRPRMPSALLRPPVLVDRAAELAAVARCLHDGLTLVVVGPPGIGKSRLVEEALADPALVLRLEGLQQDAGLPFSTLDRGLTSFVTEHGRDVLPDAALEALTPSLPSLRRATGGAGEGRDARRFEDALAAGLTYLMERGFTLVADDLQSFDDASFDALMGAADRVPAAHGNGGAAATPWRALACVRPGELDRERSDVLDRAVAAGRARRLVLGPLGPQGAVALLESLGLPALAPSSVRAFADRLYRHTGGNVLFMVECLKDLAAEEGGVGEGARLPLPQRVSEIIRQRVARLSPGAQRIALAAAIADGDFDLGIIAAMLSQDPLTLDRELRSLEDAQVIHDGVFTHDLIAEALVDTAAEPVRRFLHARAADALAAGGAEPARIARHFLDAGDGERALPFLVRAAGRARDRLAYRAAGEALVAAAGIAEEAGRSAEAFEHYVQAYDQVRHGDARSLGDRIVDALERLATTPAHLARLEHARSELLASAGRGAPAEEAARRGLEAAARAGDAALEAQLATDLATALFARESYEDAADAFAAGIAAARSRGDDRGLVEGLANRAVTLDRLARYDEASALHREAAALLERLGDEEGRIAVLTNLAVSIFESGRPDRALHVHDEVATLLEGAPEVSFAHLVHWANTGVCERDLDRLGRAHELLTRARDTAARLDYWGSSVIERHLADLHARLGDASTADTLARRALERAAGRPDQELGAHLQLAELRLQQGRSPRRELAAAARLQASAPHGSRIWYMLVRAAAHARPGTADLDAALRDARRALTLAEERGLVPYALNAHALLAKLLVHKGHAEAALTHARAAASSMNGHAPRRGTRAEILWVQWLALAAMRDPGADAALDACRTWVETTAERHVPAEMRHGFRHAHPTHRAILAAAGS